MPAAQNITGKIMLVTGASTGIGRASADRLAAAGAVVVGAPRLSAAWLKRSSGAGGGAGPAGYTVLLWGAPEHPPVVILAYVRGKLRGAHAAAYRDRSRAVLS